MRLPLYNVLLSQCNNTCGDCNFFFSGVHDRPVQDPQVGRSPAAAAAIAERPAEPVYAGAAARPAQRRQGQQGPFSRQAERQQQQEQQRNQSQYDQYMGQVQYNQRDQAQVWSDFRPTPQYDEQQWQQQQQHQQHYSEAWHAIVAQRRAAAAQRVEQAAAEAVAATAAATARLDQLTGTCRRVRCRLRCARSAVAAAAILAANGDCHTVHVRINSLTVQWWVSSDRLHPRGDAHV